MTTTEQDIGRLAEQFRIVMREWFADEPEKLVEIDRLNREWVGTKSETCCATADFCDSNMAMDEAWKRCFDTDPDDTDPDFGEEPFSCAVWNRAWDQAKQAGFALNCDDAKEQS